jgi:hypothetical protein
MSLVHASQGEECLSSVQQTVGLEGVQETRRERVPADTCVVAKCSLNCFLKCLRQITTRERQMTSSLLQAILESLNWYFQAKLWRVRLLTPASTGHLMYYNLMRTARVVEG